ncbi:MAG: heterodisulfide reductase-related iron-sulfur binding cluster [Thermoleophilia bacterium]|nr:heterodisulfide reductase-related iron-sulfur binding cluster [Thermoleophilia bacterium]
MGSGYAREYLPFMPGWTLWLLYPLFALILAALAWALVRRYSTYRRRAESLRDHLRAVPGSPRRRLRAALADALLQRKVLERRLPAVFHLPIFYGMVLLTIGTTLVFLDEDVVRHLDVGQLMSGWFYVVWEALLDLAGIGLVAGVLIALYRRLVLRPSFLPWRPGTVLILAGLLYAGVTGFLLEGYRIAVHPNDWAAASFVGYAISGLWGGAAGEAGGAVLAYRLLWWSHAAAAFALIAALGLTGLSHILTVPGNVFAQDLRRPRAKLTTPFNLAEVLESEEEVELISGVAATGDLAPAARLGADACVACGRCHAECPAAAAGRLLSPRDLILDVQESVRWGGPVREAAYFEAASWSCTNCYACEEACPARIRHVDYVLDFRRALVDQNRLDEQKLSVLEALDRNLNPYKLPSHERASWLAQVPYAGEILVGETEEPAEWLYWMGCSAGYDSRVADVALATMRLLRAARVSFATLGPAEPCCGEPAKRLGEEGRFQLMAAVNMELIREAGASRVVTHCPHCMHILAQEYGSLGFDIPVLHHTELLAELVRRRRLPVQAGVLDLSAVAYHEPCNLARAGRPAAALEVLASLGQTPPVLPARSGRRTFCCGGGGANMWYTVEPEEQRISAIRLEELAATGATTVATACPFCLPMLNDAAGSREGERLAVRDVAEILAEGLTTDGPGNCTRNPADW